MSDLVSLEASYDEKTHADPWRNNVARQLNVVLGWAQYFEETQHTPDADMARMIEDSRALVRRVAEFEEINENPAHPRKDGEPTS